MSTRTPALCVAIVAAFALFMMPGTARAQLAATTWLEGLNLTADSSTDSKGNTDTQLPEELSGSLQGDGYSVVGSVTFAPSGPPQATCTVDASYQSGLTSYLGGNATILINFQFAVREIETPPVTVTEVPVSVHTTATVDVGQDATIRSIATASFALATSSGVLANYSVFATNEPGPLSDMFDESNQFLLAPDMRVTGTLSAGATVAPEGLQNNTSGSAVAFIDPVIEVADVVIPNSGDRTYGEFFEVEFGPGYYSLNTPVIPTTWGKIKRLYVD
jgi:hypothetical protein